ncbi:hypothetical protein GLOTRDRAFT_76241 [Gloeophyllum trabeum ATCC 11539]|uniref:Ubinuclein middle domain-containing protein n=1 Tax=Gloeophyllum trabeum (strain ATCC 11539 / FP-39264 / Madison 617) TaxID=670483 RepID=S7RNH2_GLOTA|nr:uncharacterized protein GLOTRDRAFT_76241 [Gloeophyllum trabeum ATCC 11539]EPQ56020.1 hypothetical protein GLOTRDRAFT_76241 [Gloeophyllum trabeum ATCC 11539]
MAVPAEIRQKTPSEPPSLASPPPASDSSRTSHAADDDGDTETQSTSAASDSPSTPAEAQTVDGEHVVDGGAQEPPAEATSPETQPSESAAAKPASSTAAKPKSTKAPRPPSPTPPPPPPPPPQVQTIRLNIPLGGPDAYEVDISNLAKSLGQRSPTPPPPKIDTSDSEGDDEASGKDKGKDEKKKRKRKKNLGGEYYDLTDPFIDDSDLALDQRTHFAQTKQQGFYVSSGEVQLLKEKTPKKPKSKKLPLLPLTHPSISVKREDSAVAGPSNVSLSAVKDGTRDTPIPVLSDNEDDRAGLKRKTSLHLTDGKGKKKRKTADIRPFHPELERMIEDLKVAILKESWDVKGKFPPAIKPILAQVAIKAIQLDEYDDNFFNLLPQIFPYNRFTMAKLVKRTIFQDHMRLLAERQEVLLHELAEMAREGFPRAQEEWEKSVAQWERRQERAKAEAEASGVGSTEGTPSVPPPHLPSPDDSHVNGDADHEGGNVSVNGAGKEGGREPHPPSKKYRLTDPMRVIIWNLVLLSNESCRIENEKNSLENSPLQVSEQGLRKVLYQKIVAAFPEGWMSSGQISREVSAMKKRFEKEAMENESQ